MDERTANEPLYFLAAAGSPSNRSVSPTYVRFPPIRDIWGLRSASHPLQALVVDRLNPHGRIGEALERPLNVVKVRPADSGRQAVRRQMQS